MKKMPTHKPKIAVIGGGISGLSAAFWLTQHNMDALLFEQTGRPGGLIRSEKNNGYLLDHAANCLLNFLPEVNSLCDVVGIKSEQTYRSALARKRYILKEGRPVPLPQSVLQLINTSLLSLRGKIRFMSEPLIPRVKSEEDETVSQFVSRRLGREILEQVMEPFIGGTYAGDPFQLCAKSTLPMFHSLEQRYGSLIIGAMIRRLKGSRGGCPMHLFSFRQGMEAMPRAIALYLGKRFVPHSRVESLVNHHDGTWELAISGNEETHSYKADAVVIATPSIEAARLISALDPDISNAIRNIEYSPLIVVHTGFKKDSIDHPLDGIGCMIPAREKGRVLLGTLWNSTLFDGRAPEGMVSFTNYVGGKRHPETVKKSDSEIVDLTLNDLKKIMKLKGNPAFISVTRHQRAIPQYSIGHQGLVRRIEGISNLHPGLYVTGNYLRGISVRDCISYGARVARNVASSYGNMV